MTKHSARNGVAAAFALAAILASACAGRFAQLDRLLDGADFSGAAAWACGDPVREDALAAGILARAALGGDDALGAIRELAASGDRGRPDLEHLRSSGVHPAAELATIALSRRRPPSDEALASLLANASGDVRAYALSTWADDVAPNAAAGLALDLDPSVRRAAIRALGRFDEGERSAVMRDAARLDPDLGVRAEALRHGRALGDDALALLRDAVRGMEPGEVQAALLGLGDLGSADAIALLEERALGVLDETAVVAAAELARLGNTRGRDRLYEALADERPGVRIVAAVNLARAGLRDRDARLLTLLDDAESRVALTAAALLADRAHDARVIAALGKIRVGDLAANEEARDMLAARGDAKASEELARALDGAEEEVALRSLGRIRATPPLRARIAAMLGDPRPRVRRAAAEALLR
jgi:HEAT repeat protein